eukprot:906085_1
MDNHESKKNDSAHFKYNDKLTHTHNTKKTHRIKSATELLWMSDNCGQWNKLYKHLLNILPNTKDPSTVQAKLSVLEGLRSSTLRNTIILTDIVSLFRDNITTEKQLKHSILKHLPTCVIKLPVVSKFKPLQYESYCTLQTFPDSNPTAHWMDMLRFISEWSYNLILNHRNDTDQMTQLFKTQANDSQSQASEKLNGATQLYSRKIVSSHAP